jgi:hypothetical protein
MMSRVHPTIGPQLGIGLFCAALVSCVPAEHEPPFDTAQAIRELTSELRELEGMPSEFAEAVVLAWRIDTRPGSTSAPAIPVPGGSGMIPARPERAEVVLMWARTDSQPAPRRWVVVQGWRRPQDGTPWQRSTINRELSAPLTHLRPGEDVDGTWHGYQRYDRPPTAREVCDFAAVNFVRNDRLWERVAGGFRTTEWTRVLGEAPVCGFPGAAEIK